MCIRDRGASYDEMVDIQLKDGTTRAGRIVQIEGEKVVVQVFEGTNGLSLENTKTRLLDVYKRQVMHQKLIIFSHHCILNGFIFRPLFTVHQNLLCLLYTSRCV